MLTLLLTSLTFAPGALPPAVLYTCRSPRCEPTPLTQASIPHPQPCAPGACTPWRQLDWLERVTLPQLRAYYRAVPLRLNSRVLGVDRATLYVKDPALARSYLERGVEVTNISRVGGQLRLRITVR